MRVLVVDSYYDAFVRQVYEENPGLADASYDVQKSTFMQKMFGTSDFYSSNLDAIGHVGTEVIASCGILQNRWAMEHGMRAAPAGDPIRGSRRLPWALQVHARANAKILMQQVREFRPDVVHFQNPVATPREVVQMLRPHTRVVTAQVASHVPDFAALRHFDMVLSSFPHYVPRFRQAGVKSEYFNLGFEPRVLTQVKRGDSHDVVFVGGLSPRHAARTAWLESVAARVPVKWWGYGVEHLADDSPLRAAFQGEAWGVEMYNIFFNSRIVLNHHIDEAEDNANNMRLYEATGTGALLLTDAKKNLSDLFEPGREVVTYSDADSCVANIQALRADEDLRARIASAGQQRTLGSHTYRHRMQEFVNILGPLVASQ